MGVACYCNQKMLATILTVIASSLVVLYLVSRRKKFSFKGKHVLVTGGSSGIGMCLAECALSRGAERITLLARKKENLQHVQNKLKKQFPSQTIDIISGDVSDPQIQQIVQQALSDDTTPVDVLINCAGITHTASLVDTPTEKYKDIMNTNLIGSVAVTKAVLPAMIKRKRGKVVFISSQAGQLGLYGYTAYSSSKYALRGLAETLQMEVKPFNIGISISFPCDTNTPQLQNELLERTPMVKELASYGQVMQPEEVAAEVLTGVERGLFQISHGFDGFMLATVTAGASPVSSMFELLTQAVLMGVFRVVAVGYNFTFNRIVWRGVQNV